MFTDVLKEHSFFSSSPAYLSDSHHRTKNEDGSYFTELPTSWLTTLLGLQRKKNAVEGLGKSDGPLRERQLNVQLLTMATSRWN